MRSFIVASVILILICIMITVNTFYVTNKLDELLVLCDDIKNSSSPDAVEELTAAWENCRDIISLSIHRSDLERVESALLALDKYYDSKSDFAYQLSLLNAALTNIRDNQHIKLNSVF